jgi:hypothetical protein
MNPPYNHQIVATERLWNNDIYALIMEQGTGKSRPIVEDWLARVDANRADDLVVIGPKGAYMNWIGTPDEPGEITKWVPPDRKGIYYAPWISGAKAAERDALIALLHVKKPRFLCMNIEALNTQGPAREYLLQFVKERRVIGVIDESTTIAHEEAQRTKFLLAHREKFVARRILSGLVAPESPMDLFSQYAYLDWQIIGLNNFYAFRNRYAYTQKEVLSQKHHIMKALGKTRKIPTVILGYRNLAELHDKIMKFSYRTTKEECLDLPPQNYEFYDVDMTDQQARIYWQMRDVAMAELEADKFTTAIMKLDQLSKLQHILCGHVRQEDKSLYDIPEKRTDAVV